MRQNEMGSKRGSPSSNKSNRTRSKSTPPRIPQSSNRRSNIYPKSNTIRYKPKPNKGCCSNPETRKGIGAVIFTLGIPCLIAGLIITIVASTSSDSNKYPEGFIAGGPTLLVFSVFLFVTGILLHSSYARKACQSCFSLNEPDSFCRVTCPRLSNCLSPDESIKINQSAMRALQAEPAKSVLKRKQFLLDPSMNNNNVNVTNAIPQADGKEDEMDVFNNVVTFPWDGKNQRQGRINSRGVRFSDSGADEGERKRTSSVASDNGSLLSLKHCKIYPKSDIWWTDETTSPTLHIEAPKDSPIQTTEL